MWLVFESSECGKNISLISSDGSIPVAAGSNPLLILEGSVVCPNQAGEWCCSAAIAMLMLGLLLLKYVVSFLFFLTNVNVGARLIRASP